MTAATDFTDDEYLLPLPTRSDPVVLEHLVEPMHAHLNARYGDRVWPLAPLTANPSARKLTIRWDNCPPVFEGELRRAAWHLINGELRPTFLQSRPNGTRARLSLEPVVTAVRAWFNLAHWLVEHGISTLAACDRAVWDGYAAELIGPGRRRGWAQTQLSAYTRLWALDRQAVRPLGVGRTPWDEFGYDDYLPAADPGGENATAPISEATMGPLLVWSMRLVEEFADDILAAWAERRRMESAVAATVGSPAGRDAVVAYAEAIITDAAPIPATMNAGVHALARTYIAAQCGASLGQVQHHIVTRIRLTPEQIALRAAPCPLPTPISGTVRGRPWRAAIDFDEAAELMKHLATAAFVTCCFLTGMRTQEVLGLRSGCCPDPEPHADGTVGQHLIRGIEYKNAHDERGNHRSAGTQREAPWVAIAPVVSAIRVLERMVPDGALLFDTRSQDLQKGEHTANTGSLKPFSMGRRIESFVTWANTEAARHALAGQAIPPDPGGALGTRRFRRSLAWHIARRPGGLVALAIQYGHMRTLVSSGYANRGRDGIHQLVDVETALAVADTIANLREDLGSGGGVSGPAARAAIKAASAPPLFAGKTVNATTARRLLANDEALIFDNPQAFLLCNYKRESALCHRDGIKAAPSLERCDPRCANICRTDAHAIWLRARADALEQQAPSTPEPVAERLHATAARLRRLADQHDENRITLERTP